MHLQSSGGVMVQCFASGYWGDGQRIQWYVLTSLGPFLRPWLYYMCEGWLCVQNSHCGHSQKNGSYGYLNWTTKVFLLRVLILFNIISHGHISTVKQTSTSSTTKNALASLGRENYKN